MVLSEEIAKIAKEQVINNTSPPIEVRITKVYSDKFVDVSFSNGDFFHIKCNGSAKVGDTGIVIFIDNDADNPTCIISGDLSDYYTKEEIDEIISGGSADLKQYVKKADVALKFDLEDNGTIIIGIDIGDGF